MMDANKLLIGGGLIAGFVAGFWSGFKTFLFKIFSLVFVHVELQDNELRKAFRMWLVSECKCPFNRSGGDYYSELEYVQPLSKNQTVAFKRPPSNSSIWIFGKKLFLIKDHKSPDGISITFVRGTFDSDSFVSMFVNRYNNIVNQKKSSTNSGTRFFVKRMRGSIGRERTENQLKQEATEASIKASPCSSYDIDKDQSYPLIWKRNELGLPVKCGSMDNLSLKENVLLAYTEAVRWKKSEKWFKARKVPWKRGFLLFGIPGSGKTAFVRALGQELDIPIFSFDMSTMTNTNFSDSWNEASSYAPCIALFEDVDGVFDGRKNVACNGLSEKGLSFDCFLNVMDGVDNSEGILKIVTTNDLSKIDPALGIQVNGSGMSSRPGRIDRIVEFTQLDEVGRLKMAKRIFEGFQESEWKSILDEGKNDTGAQFQERCCRLAMKLFWDKGGTDEDIEMSSPL